MLRNSNHRFIRKMATRSVKNNWIRNMILTTAILLSSFLLFTLITVGITYIQMHKMQTVRLAGGEYDAVMYGVSEEQRNLCESDPDIQLAGIEAVAGYVKETKEDATPDVGLLWADTTFWEQMKTPAREWTKGTYPQKDDEVMVTQKALKKCGFEELELGDSFVMTYGTPSGEITKEFRISGMWSGYGGEEVFYVSKSFYEQSGQDLASVSSGRYYISFRETAISKKAEETFTENLNLTKKQRLFFAGDSQQKKEVLLGLTALVAVTCLCAYLLIYNIMYLVIAGNVRYYGLLQTLGMTGKQILRFMQIQMIWITSIGISLGILLGSGVAFGLIPSVIKVLGIRSGQVEISFHPFILLGTIIITCFTVYAGSRKPLKIAADISPLKALTYNRCGAVKRADKKRTENGRIIWRLAKEQITKDKKKTGIVMLSLGTSLAVFLCVVTLIESQGPRTVVSNLASHDMIVENATLRKEEQEEWKQILTEEVVSDVGEVDGVKEIVTQLNAPVVVPWEPKFADLWMEEFYATWMEKPYEEDVEEYKENPQNFGSFLVGIDEKKFEMLNATLETPIDKKRFLAGETCVLVRNGLGFWPKELNGKYVQCAPCETPENTKAFEIVGLTDERYFYSELIGYPPIIIVTNQMVKDMTSNWFVQKASILYEKEYDKKTESEILSVLENSDYAKDFSYESKIDDINTIKKAQGNMMEIGVGMVCILMFIGMLNYVNTISGNIQSRRTEFSILESLGMTERQMKKMLALEGMLFLGGSLLLAFTVGLGVVYWIFQSMNYNQTPFFVPILPVVGMVAFMCVVCAGIPLIARRLLHN